VPDLVLVEDEPVAVAPATLDQRLKVVRSKRKASHLAGATTVAAWVAGLIALLTIAGVGLLSVH
jgi:hypothetical protein